MTLPPDRSGKYRAYPTPQGSVEASAAVGRDYAAPSQLGAAPPQAGENRQPLAGIAGDPRRVGVVDTMLEQPVRELVQVAQGEDVGAAVAAEPLEQIAPGGAVDALADLLVDVAVLPHLAQPLLLHLLRHAQLKRLLHLDAIEEVQVGAVLGGAQQPP